MHKIMSIAGFGLVVALTLTTASAANAEVDAWDIPVNISAAGQGAFYPELVTDGTTITAAWVRYDGSHGRVQAAASTDGGVSWSSPFTISAAGQSAFDVQLATDGATVTAVWSRDDGSDARVQSAASTDGGISWSSPTTISAAGQGAFDPQLVTDGTTITAVWSRYDGTDNRIQAAISTDGGVTWDNLTNISAAGQNSYGPELVTDGATITAVWDRNDGSNERIQAAASTDGGITWGIPTTISAIGENGYDPEMVTDGATVTVVWDRFNGSYSIQAAASTDGGITWSSPTTVSTTGDNALNPRLATDGTTITTIWSRDDGSDIRIQAAASTDGGITWSSPATISAPGQYAYDPRVVTDGTNVTAAWSGFDGTDARVRLASSADGGMAWGSPITISSAGASPALVADGAIITAAWSGYDGTDARIQVSSFTYPPTTRIAGPNRFSTSAAVAQKFATADVVYVANGRNYPDALSAAPAAAHQGGPLLLTEQGSLPGVIAAEIVRLDPTTIVVVGGDAVVSPAVEAALEALQPGNQVYRIAGANRYETSRMVTAYAFPSGAATAFVATGTNFPDALSASAAAGHYGGPVILTYGPATSIDADTLTLLDTLNTTEVLLAGGTGVVSAGIETSLNTLFGDANVRRLAGANRYGTSIAINTDTFVTSTTVYLAVGTGYADALSGAALAGKNDSPLFVVPGTCVPQATLDAIAAFGATDIVLLGGTGVLSPSVANLTSCG